MRTTMMTTSIKITSIFRFFFWYCSAYKRGGKVSFFPQRAYKPGFCRVGLHLQHRTGLTVRPSFSANHQDPEPCPCAQDKCALSFFPVQERVTRKHGTSGPKRPCLYFLCSLSEVEMAKCAHLCWFKSYLRTNLVPTLGPMAHRRAPKAPSAHLPQHAAPRSTAHLYPPLLQKHWGAGPPSICGGTETLTSSHGWGLTQTPKEGQRAGGDWELSIQHPPRKAPPHLKTGQETTRRAGQWEQLLSPSCLPTVWAEDSPILQGNLKNQGANADHILRKLSSNVRPREKLASDPVPPMEKMSLLLCLQHNTNHVS